MAPTRDEVAVAVAALRTDARMWLDMADEVRAAARIGERLDLTALHFSYLGDKAGLTETYREVQDTLVRLLNEGGSAFDALAGALRAAADGYEDDDRNAAEELYGTN